MYCLLLLISGQFIPTLASAVLVSLQKTERSG
jgi:hypothetical protein